MKFEKLWESVVSEIHHTMPHLHIHTSGEANSKENNERNYIFALSFVALFALPFVVLALEAVFWTRVKGDKWRFVLCVWTCECLYACEDSSFAKRQRHTNVRASGEARHVHECVNVVLGIVLLVHHTLTKQVQGLTCSWRSTVMHCGMTCESRWIKFKSIYNPMCKRPTGDSS